MKEQLVFVEKGKHDSELGFRFVGIENKMSGYEIKQALLISTNEQVEPTILFVLEGPEK